MLQNGIIQRNPLFVIAKMMSTWPATAAPKGWLIPKGLAAKGLAAPNAG